MSTHPVDEDDRDDTGREERAEELAEHPVSDEWAAWAKGGQLPEQAPAYVPMTNDRRDFDPMSDDWSYILDNYPADTWRDLVAVKSRRATWPFTDRGVTGDRWGKAWHSARLSPDWAFYAWGHEYVLASWDEARPHEVQCRVTFTRRYPDPEFGHRITEWAGHLILDLREQTQTLQLCPRDAERALPDDVAAEAAHKGAKLLAFFNDACEHWRAGDQPRPVQAYDLAHPDD